MPLAPNSGPPRQQLWLVQEPILAKVLSYHDGDTCILDREVLLSWDQRPGLLGDHHPIAASARTRLKGAHRGHASRGMFLRSTFGRLLGRARTHFRMPLSCLQAAHGQCVQLQRPVCGGRRISPGDECQSLRALATRVAASRIASAPIVGPPFIIELILSQGSLPSRLAPSQTSPFRHPFSPSITRAGAISGLISAPNRY
jgi:hypothetical protein